VGSGSSVGHSDCRARVRRLHSRAVAWCLDRGSDLRGSDGRRGLARAGAFGRYATWSCRLGHAREGHADRCSRRIGRTVIL
jgi:hypothetical protein